MGIQSALYSGVSGLAANGQAMAAIGNNIANNNTIGFKGSRTVFADLLSSTVAGTGGSSQVGRGVSMSTVDEIFTQGTFENTENGTDLAIEGDAFFIAMDPSTFQLGYTRAGAFRFDKDGFLVNPEGNRVQGFALDDLGNIASDVESIEVDARTLNAGTPTSEITFGVNLDATAPYKGGFDINDPAATSNFSTTITIFDSLGEEHMVTAYFATQDPATNPLEWDFYATTEGAEIGAGAGPTIISQGTLTFNADGTLAAQTPDPAPTTAGILDWTNNADDTQQINIDFTATQYATPSMSITQSQNGDAAGAVADLAIDGEGNVTANYTNGQTKPLYRIALAKFSNPSGLEKSGSNMYSSSTKSGPATIGTVESGMGKIFTNALEQSNVDLAMEFVKMISTQRGFQANSKIITATDEMMSELINLKR